MRPREGHNGHGQDDSLGSALFGAAIHLTAGTVGAASLHTLTEVPCDPIDDAETVEPMGSPWPNPSSAAGDELRRLARDSSDSVRVTAAVGLARAIERASAPERIDLVCTWALSEDRDERLALARALTWSTPVFVADLVLEQLAADSNTAVRAAALAAVAKHFHEDSTAYVRIVSKCLEDQDRNVQKLARALFKRARG
ncbi:MAG: hypothetical protein ABUL60_34660 [Myxococcales bacterium]